MYGVYNEMHVKSYLCINNKYESSFDIFGKSSQFQILKNKIIDLQEVHSWYVNVLSASFYAKSPTIL